MWDYDSIKLELEEARFHDVRRAQYQDSSDPMFKLVEDMGRWKKNLGVECMKPAGD